MSARFGGVLAEMLTLLMLGGGGVKKPGLKAEIKKEKILKIEFFLKPGLIPSQRDQLPQKIFLMLTKSVFDNL